MNLNQWAIKWSIPFEAVEDLRLEFGSINTDPKPDDDVKSEAAVQVDIRLEATRKGGRLWRNNVGGTYTADGGFLRYGLCNESKNMNNQIKSADLIGLKPVLIESYHVGMLFGQFVARECKPTDWIYTATEREVAQLKFLELVASLGGDASFANSEGTL